MRSTAKLRESCGVASARMVRSWHPVPTAECWRCHRTRSPHSALDDYHDYGGAKKAVDDFVAEHRDFTFEDGANVLLSRVAACG